MKRKQAEEAVKKAKRTTEALNQLQRQLPHLLARDTETAGRDGYSAGGAGPGRSYDPRPTEAVALTRIDKGLPPDPLHLAVVKLLKHLDEASIQGAAIMLVLSKLDRDANATSGLPVCANPQCSSVITFVENDRPRRGRCRPCYEYLRVHDRDRTERSDRLESDSTTSFRLGDHLTTQDPHTFTQVTGIE